jgi:hypothetical protein
MKFTFNFFQIILVFAVFSLTMTVMGASNDGAKIINASPTKIVNPVELNSNIECLSDNAISLQAKDKDKCPEKTPGGGAGEVSGGMCHYPVPDGGCSTLGDDCSDSTLRGEATCRCLPKKDFMPGSSDPGQVQSPDG